MAAFSAGCRGGPVGGILMTEPTRTLLMFLSWGFAASRAAVAWSMVDFGASAGSLKRRLTSSLIVFSPLNMAKLMIHLPVYGRLRGAHGVGSGLLLSEIPCVVIFPTT